MAKDKSNQVPKTAPAPAKVALMTAAPAASNDDDGADDAAPVARASKVDRSSAGAKRFYQGSQEIDHDLFKLELATMKKNVSFTDIPFYENIEHVHVFHTIDSSGRKQEACTPVGGHFHLVTTSGEKDGVPTLEISPPMKHVMKRVKGRNVRVAVLFTDEDPEGDTHTHTVVYLKSEKVKLRQANAQFASFEAAVHAKQSPSIDGIVSA